MKSRSNSRMKKLPKDYRLRQQRIADDRFKRKKPGKPRRRAPHRLYVSGFEIIFAPRSFIMTPENISEVVEFIRRLNKKGVSGQRMTIDFSKTVFMSALGTVYVYSEISKIQTAYQRAVVRIRTETVSSIQVAHTLQESGLLQLCGSSAGPRGDFLPIVQGKGDDRLSEITKYVLSTALSHGQLGDADRDHAELLVHKAISEAMLNVQYHAYPQDKEYNFWWVTAAIFENELHIALCDRGVGIPKTLLKKAWFKKFAQTFELGVDDAKMIKEAMIYTRSSRKKRAGAGWGSRDIQRLVLDHGRGRLTIISGAGHYHLQTQDNKPHETTRKIRYDVAGTLIQWRIPLQQPTGGKR